MPARISDCLHFCNTAVLYSFRYLIRQDCHLSYVPSIKRARYFDSKLSRFPTFLNSCIPAIRKAELSAILNVFYPFVLKYVLTVFLPTFKGKELIIFIPLYRCGSIWHSKAVFCRALYCNTLMVNVLLCKMIFINGFIQKPLDKMDFKQNGFEPFFPVTFNPSRRADFCVHQNTASCVLRHSKPSSCLKTTCPAGS